MPQQTVNSQNAQGTEPEVVLEKEKSTTPPDADSNIVTTSSRPKKGLFLSHFILPTRGLAFKEV